MLVMNKKEFTKGLYLAVSFLIALAVMFLPIFGNGRNAFRAADRLYNSIAKGSTYYMPALLKQNAAYLGHSIDVVLNLDNPEILQKAGRLYAATGAKVQQTGSQLRLVGDLGQITALAIKQSDTVFHNRGEEIAQQFGFLQREALFVWHYTLKAMGKNLTKQKQFADAAWLEEVNKRGVEVAYNFYKIEPRSAYSSAGILGFSLVFYVIYTMWWGFAILFLFEGLGLEMKAGRKKEV